MMRRLPLIILLVPLALLSGCGVTAPRSNAGHADLDSLGLRDTDRVMSISIGPSLLRLAARYTEDDPEIQALLRNLHGVRVRVYEVNGNLDNVSARMERMSERLQRRHWQPVMLVREEGELTQMLMKVDEDRVAGLLVMTMEADEAVIVNVMGDLHPDDFSGTMAILDVPAKATTSGSPTLGSE